MYPLGTSLQSLAPSPPQLTSGICIPKCLRKKLLQFPLQIQVRRVVRPGGWELRECCLALCTSRPPLCLCLSRALL